MKILKGLDVSVGDSTGATGIDASVKGAALAIGNFDGVHRGHQALLAEAKAQARSFAGPAGVMLFDPHPRELFAPDKPHFRLTTLQQRLGLLEIYGMDVAVVLPFDRALASLSATAFIEDILVAKLDVRHVVIGYDFFFGKGRAGTARLMREMGKALGFGVSVIEPVAEEGEVFSSSGVRALLGQGEVRDAAAMLGHWWRAIGTVTGGAKRGTGLGFPTANITLPKATTLAHGIYAVRVYGEGLYCHGAAYLGTRPTFDDGVPVLEVFLFDFDGDLYGREIEVEFIAHLREDRRFADGEALSAQMQADCDQARAILAKVDAADPFARPVAAERSA